MNGAMTKGHVCVDLDGTLAKYDKWRGVKHIGEPVLEMVERVKEWLDQGIEVRIFTARASHSEEKLEAIPIIQEWCKKHIGQVLEITCQKDYATIEIWDDRAIHVIPNTGKPLGKSRIE